MQKEPTHGDSDEDIRSDVDDRIDRDDATHLRVEIEE
jgi:hypothetical protein